VILVIEVDANCVVSVITTLMLCRLCPCQALVNGTELIMDTMSVSDGHA